MTLLISGTATVMLNPSNLHRSASAAHELHLTIDADATVMGVQFDLQYNPGELVFNGAASLLDEFMFEYRDKENGIVRGLLFSMSGAVINLNQLADIISFDFSPVDGFKGESQVEFVDLILAGEHGVKIPVITSSIVVSSDILVPDETRLQSCYPNPFNPVTTISYDLAIAGQVEIMVYDILGRQVTSLVNDYQPAGSYEIIWNASDYSSGFYLMRMQTEGFHSIQKVLLMK